MYFKLLPCPDYIPREEKKTKKETRKKVTVSQMGAMDNIGGVVDDDCTRVPKKKNQKIRVNQRDTHVDTHTVTVRFG